MIKLGPKTLDCAFIDYVLHSTTYRFLVVKSKIPNINNSTIMESIKVEFFDNVFPFKEERHNEGGSKSKYESSSSKGQVGKEIEVEPRRSKRAKKVTSFGLNFLIYMLEDESQTFNKVMTYSDAPYWNNAINSEMEFIIQN